MALSKYFKIILTSEMELLGFFNFSIFSREWFLNLAASYSFMSSVGCQSP